MIEPGRPQDSITGNHIPRLTSRTANAHEASATSNQEEDRHLCAVLIHRAVWFQVHRNDYHWPVEQDRQAVQMLSKFFHVLRGQMCTVKLNGNAIQTRMTTRNLRFQVRGETANLHLYTSQGIRCCSIVCY